MNFVEVYPTYLHLQLLESNSPGCILAFRPGEFILLEFLLPKTESIPILISDFQQPMLTAEKQEQTPENRIMLHTALYQDTQSVDVFFEIGHAWP